MLISIQEMFDLVVMTCVVGYIFMDMLVDEPKLLFMHGFDWRHFRLACLISAPAVVFHELAHKLVAVGLGLKATFHAAYGWLLFGAAMRMLNTGLVFFVPGYVSIEAIQSPFEAALTAFAGPAVNGMLYLGARLAMAKIPHMKIQTFRLLAMTRKLNGFLFLFNMIPVFGFDGEKVWWGVMSWLS